MRKAILFVSCFLFCASVAFSQQKMLSGYLKDSLTHLPIAGGTLSNPASRTKIQTDETGFFRLPVSQDNLLYALAPHYSYDTLRYSVLFRDTITIYLVPVSVMEAVTIETGYPKYRMDSLQRRRDFEESRGHTVNTVERSSQKPYFGLTINLDRLFKKKYKNKKKDEQSFQHLEQQAYVGYRFPPQLVSFYTGLKGDELLTFMRLYTPSYEWLRNHVSKEQVIDYLSEKLPLYRKSLTASH
jgi:hypothetical protein